MIKSSSSCLRKIARLVYIYLEEQEGEEPKRRYRCFLQDSLVGSKAAKVPLGRSAPTSMLL